jgi:glycosyltransferase involved in cell wall biosynthesis
LTSAPCSTSIIIPVHNQEQHVAPLYEEIRTAVQNLDHGWEVIFINDGSSDETLERLEALQAEDPHVRLLDLDANYGEGPALSAGFHGARGDFVITLAGDGQNDPADIPRFVAALEKPGIAVVCGRRIARQEDSRLRQMLSRLVNALVTAITGVPAHDCGCRLKSYRRSVVPPLHLPPGMHRFLPGIFGVAPQSVVELPTRDRPRANRRSRNDIVGAMVFLRDLLALPFLLRDSRRAEINFALATGVVAVLGAILVDTSRSATALCDGVAVLLGLIWWSTRRFNRAQTNGAYRIRREYPPASLEPPPLISQSKV